ncbi:hypothetical protein [Rhodococcus gannanensis]|uniref:DUF2530 domain-containing protein n=1 Tax=Rhodococcus gannanensis TaxID=1960308 RepID=A0ABW4P0G2_9NOCA
MDQRRYIAAVAWAAAITVALTVIGVAGTDLLAGAFVWAAGILGGSLALLAGNHPSEDSDPMKAHRTINPAAEMNVTRPAHISPP